jgi:hypothetical protein
MFQARLGTNAGASGLFRFLGVSARGRAQFSQTKWEMPVLSICVHNSLGNELTAQAALVAHDAAVIVRKDPKSLDSRKKSLRKR